MSEKNGFAIGTVARLTGITAHTLRIWERRYGLKPSLGMADNGRRLYSQEDIDRYKLLRRLLDQGHRIGALAALDDQALAALDVNTSTAKAPTDRDDQRLTVQFCSKWMHALLSKHDLAVADWQALEAASLDTVSNSHALVVEFASLQREHPQLLTELRRDTGAQHVVVLFNFAAQAVLDELATSGIQAMRLPCTMGQIRDWLRFTAKRIRHQQPRSATESRRAGRVQALRDVKKIAEPVFSEAELSELLAAQSGITCECPGHLASIILNLRAFERYARDCEQASPAEARIHMVLEQYTADARQVMERALSDLLAFEEKAAQP